ncbi:hypothetical protein WOLCODRAFT_166318 [Wolfiporia cocos MD-104 SS10]|uniref:F-box domain-containing protein n=1 Tax=Wolfiporia cocos (strain MD-104) TaxID=742152 RepID=A0A2H3J0P7_WOLCO|nr:hypothetical protein WOLCODRAFT_166318 [Wolfiporia cocos MD-104 SS10]
MKRFWGEVLKKAKSIIVEQRRRFYFDLSQVCPPDVEEQLSEMSPSEGSLSEGSLSETYSPQEHLVPVHLGRNHPPPRYFADNVYCETQSGPRPSPLPIEIWEYILDMFQDRLDLMAVCGRVCRAWRVISKRFTNMNGHRTLTSRVEILRFSQLKRAGLHRDRDVGVAISGLSEVNRMTGSLEHIASLAAMLAGTRPQNTMLSLNDGEWPAWIPQSVFLHLSTFTSITFLTLKDVTFPSIAVFGRLTCALSGLEWLSLLGVSFSDARVPIPLGRRWATPPDLRQVQVDRSRSPSSSDMLRALVATKMVACCRVLISYVDSDILLDYIRDSSLQQALYCAGDSLRALHLGLYHSLPEAKLDCADAEVLVDTGICLSHNTSLSLLEINTSLRRPMNPNHLIWLSRLISHVSTTSIEEIRVVFEEDDSPDDTSFLIIQDIIDDTVGLLDVLRQCASLDDILSASDYTSLETVKFSIRTRFGIWDPTRDELAPWIRSVSRIFPKLHVRGILRAGVP